MKHLGRLIRSASLSGYVDLVKSLGRDPTALMRTVGLSAKLLDDPETRFTTTPQKTMQYAEFMYSIGSIKVKPGSWRDYFFSDVYDQSGS